MEYEIIRKDLPEQSALVQRKKASQGPEISKAIGDALGTVVGYAQEHGVALTGRPFARYLEVGPGSMTPEPGMFVADAGDASADGGPDDGVRMVTIPAGRVAYTLHRGPYESLREAYAALEKWMEAESLSSAGAPWEVYITDPTTVEDPSQLETEVYWPVARTA